MARERRDHAIFEAVENRNAPSGYSVRITSPADVLKVPHKDELRHLLDHYSYPFIRHVVPDSNFARRWYVEKIRPALRYYCRKFGVAIPDWLENEDRFKNLPDEEKKSLFGTTKIKPREFRPVNRNHGMEKVPGR